MTNDTTGGSLPKRGMSRRRTKSNPPQNEIFHPLANLLVKKIKAIKINEKKLMVVNKKILQILKEELVCKETFDVVECLSFCFLAGGSSSSSIMICFCFRGLKNREEKKYCCISKLILRKCKR